MIPRLQHQPQQEKPPKRQRPFYRALRKRIARRFSTTQHVEWFHGRLHDAETGAQLDAPYVPKPSANEAASKVLHPKMRTYETPRFNGVTNRTYRPHGVYVVSYADLYTF